MINKIQIHHFFNDESHSMDAFIKNRAEIEFLNLIQEVSLLLNFDIRVEKEAIKEGGLTEIWSFLGENSNQIGNLIAIVVAILTHFSGEDNETKELKKEDLRLSIEERKMRLDKERKELIKNNDTDIAKKLAKSIISKSYKVNAKRSNFYKQLNQVDKIEKISLAEVNSKDNIISHETFVAKKEFKKFIQENKDIEDEFLEDIEIEVISPILKRQKNNIKWKGFWEQEQISFSMLDKDFRDDVFNKKITFSNGTILICDLIIQRKINDLGEMVVTGYSVSKVYEHKIHGKLISTDISRSNRYSKKINQSQGDLFN